MLKVRLQQFVLTCIIFLAVETMSCDFYYLLLSPFCRSAMLTAKAVGVKLNLKEVDLFKGEHLKPEFVALNPQHIVPTLVDDDFVLWER